MSADSQQPLADRPASDGPATGAARVDAPPARTGWRELVSDTEAWAVSAAVVIGVLTACANVIFHGAIDGARDFFWSDIGGSLGIGAQKVTDDPFVGGLAALPARWWLIPIIPMLGMGVIVILDRWFPGEIKGYGLPRFLEIVNLRGGFIRRRWITLKTLSSAVTLGSGMSTGVEGPIAQIGGSIGSTVGRTLRPSAERLRVLIAAGSASAIAATFGSPVAGVMFATEVVLIGASQLQSLSLIVLATGCATITSLFLVGEEAHIHAPQFDYPLNHELMLFVLLGMLCGLLAVFFIRSFYAIGDFFKGSRLPPTIQPLVGGMVVGCVLIFFPQVASSGYETMNETFTGGFGARMLLSLALLKILMTGVTLGCGGSGGVFAPSMFIGAVFGGGFAGTVNTLIPDAIAEPGRFALIGMGTFLAAATHAPMTAIFLLWELTHDGHVVPPIMISSITATLVARRVLPDSIDDYELSRRGVDLHTGSEAHILKTHHVGALVTKEFQSIPGSMKLSDFMNYVTTTHYNVFPVVDEEHRVEGLVSVSHLREVLLKRESWPFLVVSELADTDVLTVCPTDTLYEAMEEISARGFEEIPVVEADGSGRLLGMLRRADLQNFYQKRLLAREVHG